jgi:hypothetical protein
MIKNVTKLNKKRRRALWAQALESGKYKQGKYWLREADKYCCLGVACDVFRKATRLGLWYEGDFIVGEEEERVVLPKAVMDWFGLRSNDPLLGKNPSSAISLNDDFNKDFCEIAQMVRAL